jgi:eukaryotic-like serine/threonine-protein kinase
MKTASFDARKEKPLSKLKATPAGERLDRFELIAELASGGMATVYLGRLSGVAGFQRFVAIKRLHPHLARESEFVDMFLDEARLAARIHHPNVVPILEIGESDKGYYLVMEYVEGDTAARLLARSTQAGYRLPTPIGLRIVLDALTGLHAAHELRDDERNSLHLVHRDVSPQNILVGVDGVTRITDFGVARAATRLSTTRSGQLKGKLAYMAPEQARGGEIDRRADVFAAGAVMWEMLAAKRLFKGEGEAETLNRVLFEPIPSLRVFEPSIPPAIEQVCMCALSRDPARRFPSAADMADALERTARSLGCLASAREVATYVDAIIGQEISQQREAVRAWLARSEPSRNDHVAVPSGPLLPGSSGSYPRASHPRLSPAPHPPSGSPSTVTGVSSAVIYSASAGLSVQPSSPPSRAPDGFPLPPPARRRRPLALWLGVAAVALGLVGFEVIYPRAVSAGLWGRSLRREAADKSAAQAPAATASDSSSPSVAVAPPPSPLPIPAVAVGGATDAESELPPAAAAAPPNPTSIPVAGPSKSTVGRTPRSIPLRPGMAKPPSPEKPPTNASDEPDDISRNPYR